MFCGGAVSNRKLSIEILNSLLQFFLDPPMNSLLSRCSDGSGNILLDDAITVETDANPSVSEFHWKVNGEEFSTSDSISLGEDMIGQQVDVSCVVVNVMMGDVKGNDTASCVYSLLGMIK